MSGLLVATAAALAVMVGGLIWSTRRRPRANGKSATSLDSLSLACKHLGNFHQIRQALDNADIVFVSERLGKRECREIRKERRRAVLRYVEGLREDFETLLTTATRVAALAPELSAKMESRRLRLIVGFRIRYAILRIKLRFGFADLSALASLSNALSALAVELEQVMSTVVANAALSQNQPRSSEG